MNQLVQAIVAVAVLGAMSALCAVGKVSGNDVLALASAILGAVVHASGTTAGAAAANTTTPTPPAVAPPGAAAPH